MSRGGALAEEGRIARQQDRAAAEVLDAQAQLGQVLPMLQSAGGLLGGQLDRLGDQQLLRLQRARRGAGP